MPKYCFSGAQPYVQIIANDVPVPADRYRYGLFNRFTKTFWGIDPMVNPWVAVVYPRHDEREQREEIRDRMTQLWIATAFDAELHDGSWN